MEGNRNWQGWIALALAGLALLIALGGRGGDAVSVRREAEPSAAGGWVYVPQAPGGGYQVVPAQPAPQAPPVVPVQPVVPMQPVYPQAPAMPYPPQMMKPAWGYHGGGGPFGGGFRPLGFLFGAAGHVLQIIGFFLLIGFAFRFLRRRGGGHSARFSGPPNAGPGPGTPA